MKAPNSPGLVRALGPLMATAIVVGTTIGSGVFKKPRIIAQQVDYFGLTALLWVLGGLLVALGALAYAELAVLFPRAGGNYVFIREAYGRVWGFLWGWVEVLIIRTASMAALATIFSESLADVLRDPALCQAIGLGTPIVLTPWTQHGITVAVLLGLALVNVRGVTWGGGLQFLVTLVKIGSLLAIMVLPFVAAAYFTSAAKPDVSNLTPTWPRDIGGVNFSGLGTAFLGVLWAYHGWMNIAPVAEEVVRPQRNLPLALLTGVAIIILLYLGANLGYSLIIPRGEMAALPEGTTVAAEFGRRLLGPVGGALASAAVMISVFGALNGNLLCGPRLLFALGEDGLVPPALSRIHSVYRTPAVAIMAEAVWSALLVVVGAGLTAVGLLDPDKPLFDRLTDFAMIAAILFETAAVLSIFVFRARLPQADRPYRCPGYPVVPALYLVLPAYILVNTLKETEARTEALAVLAFVAVGALVYLLAGLGKQRVPLTQGTGDSLGSATNEP